MDDNTKIVKTYYSLRAAVLVLEPLCKSSMNNPSLHCEVNLDHRKSLEIRMSRPGYSSVGFHEGTESVTILVPIVSRKDITGSNSGIFDLMDLWMLDFEGAAILDRQHPEANLDDDSGEGYLPPDDDFWWEEFQREVQYPIESAKVRYVFSVVNDDCVKGRFWTITGDLREYQYNLDDLGTDAWDASIVNDLDGFSA